MKLKSIFKKKNDTSNPISQAANLGISTPAASSPTTPPPITHPTAEQQAAYTNDDSINETVVTDAISLHGSISKIETYTLADKIMGAQERNIAELIQNADRKTILLSGLAYDYQNKYGKKPDYTGKFKNYLVSEFSDNIKICGSGGSVVVTWVGTNSEIDCGDDGSKKKTKDEEKALRNYTNQEELLTEIIQKLAISSSTKIQLGNIIEHYRNETGQLPTYEGKFKTYIVTSIPGVQAGSGEYISYHAVDSSSSLVPSDISHQENNNVAASLESSEAISNEQNNNQKKKKKKKKEKKDEVKIAVHDSSADIITFSESIRGKSDSGISAKQEEDDNVAVRGIEGFEGLSLEERNAKANELATSLFLPKGVLDGIQKNKGLSLFKSSGIENQPEGALLGHLFDGNESSNEVGEGVYINTHSPFCFITVGVQGAGKSHTSSCILESCLVPFEPGNVVKLKAPQTTLVLHYDQNTTSICEAAGLLSPHPNIKTKMNQVGHSVGAVLKEKAVILVSPAFYLQRKKFYGDTCTVKPLLFRWRSLTADHIKRIMRIESGDNQLYVASFLDLLRSYQKKAVVPDFADFLKQVRNVCSIGTQKGPLDQRINLLESIVAESEKNSGLVGESLDLVSSSKDGYHLIIADMTDPLLSKDEANGLFQVLTEQLRTLPTKGGKVLMLDEAHKYMMGEKSDGLSEAIVNAARLMRHDGLRLVVSTQSPKALAPELLELVTIAALHHFHSPDWFSYIKQKLPLGDDDFESILSLNSGDAVAFATTHDLYGPGICSFKMRIRPRITADLGSSRRNS